MALDGFIRLLHIASAMAWFGGSLFLVTRLGPAFRRAGPEALPVQRSILQNGGISVYFAPASILTVATGGYLYWAGDWFAASGAQRGMMEMGVLCGVIALLVGAVFATPAERRMRSLVQGELGPTQRDEYQALARRATLASHTILTLVIIATVGMAGRAML